MVDNFHFTVFWLGLFGCILIGTLVYGNIQLSYINAGYKKETIPIVFSTEWMKPNPTLTGILNVSK